MTEQTQNASNITLRPVVAEDYDFLLHLYASTRADEMAMVPWTDEQRQSFVRSQFDAQQDHYGRKYPSANHDVILSTDREVGHLHVARLENEIRIVDLTLLPPERNSGTGTYLLKQLLEESRQTGKDIRIYVEEFNPSLTLFKRLGFRVIGQEGFHLLLEHTSAHTTDSVV